MTGNAEIPLARLFTMLVMFLGVASMMAFSAGSASANHREFGACHATGSATNPFVYISPDMSSGHLNNDESPQGSAHEDDRAATEDELDAKACSVETNTDTTTDTDVADDGDDAGVSALPSTGQGGNGAISGSAIVLLVGASSLVALTTSFAWRQRWTN